MSGREIPDMGRLTEREAIWVAATAFEEWLATLPTPMTGRRPPGDVERELYMGTMQERALARARELRRRQGGV